MGLAPLLLLAWSSLAVLSGVVIVFLCRSRHRGELSSDTEDGDEEEEDLEDELQAREHAALMAGLRSPTALQGAADPPSAPRSSLWSLLKVPSWSSSRPKSPPVMTRRHATARKFHQPYFYPLLEESIEWFARWEASKQDIFAPDTPFEVHCITATSDYSTAKAAAVEATAKGDVALVLAMPAS